MTMMMMNHPHKVSSKEFSVAVEISMTHPSHGTNGNSIYFAILQIIKNKNKLITPSEKYAIGFNGEIKPRNMQCFLNS